MIVRDKVGNALKEGDVVAVTVVQGIGTVIKLPSGLETPGEPQVMVVQVNAVCSLMPNGQSPEVLRVVLPQEQKAVLQ